MKRRDTGEKSTEGRDKKKTKKETVVAAFDATTSSEGSIASRVRGWRAAVISLGAHSEAEMPVLAAAASPTEDYLDQVLESAKRYITLNAVSERSCRQREKAERRLDALARLMEGTSMCVAVTFVNGKFYIAANEITEGSKTEGTVIASLINGVMQYFSDVANGKMNEAMRSQLLSTIIYNACLSSTQKAGLSQQKEQILKEIRSLVEDQVKMQNTLFKECFDPKVPESKRKAYLAFAEALSRNIVEDFDKLEQSLKDKKSDIFTIEQLQALRNQSYEILKEQATKVHAELQLLSKIIELLVTGHINLTNPLIIYLGISKLCCKDCYIMLRVAQIALETKSITLDLRYAGEHNLAFAGWSCPDIFINGYEADEQAIKQRTRDDLPFIVGFVTRQVIERLKPKVERSGGKAQDEGKSRSMHPSPSSSEAESDIEDRIAQTKIDLKIFEKAIQQFLPIFIDAQIPVSEIKERVSRLVSIAEEVFESLGFKKFAREIESGNFDENRKRELLKVIKRTVSKLPMAASYLQDVEIFYNFLLMNKIFEPVRISYETSIAATSTTSTGQAPQP